MKLLIDTHVWLWMLTTPERLSDATRAALVEPENELVLSVASAWEAALKHALGKLPLSGPPGVLVEASTRDLGVKVLPIALEHALVAAGLPLHHNDPFDRILVAQAALENMTLVTADEMLARYGGALMWAA